MLLLCYYNSTKFFLKNKAMSLAIAKKKIFSPVFKWFKLIANLWQLYSLLHENIVLRYWFYIFILSQTLSTQNVGLFTDRSWLSGTNLRSPFLNLTFTKDKRSLVPVTLPARYHSSILGLWTAITDELTDISFISGILSITSTGSVRL